MEVAMNAGAFQLLFKNLSDFILTDGTKESAFLRVSVLQHEVCGSCCVERGAARDLHDVFVSPDLIVQGNMLGFSETSLSVLQFVLSEELFVLEFD